MFVREQKPRLISSTFQKKNEVKYSAVNEGTPEFTFPWVNQRDIKRTTHHTHAYAIHITHNTDTYNTKHILTYIAHTEII